MLLYPEKPVSSTVLTPPNSCARKQINEPNSRSRCKVTFVLPFPLEGRGGSLPMRSIPYAKHTLCVAYPMRSIPYAQHTLASYACLTAKPLTV